MSTFNRIFTNSGFFKANTGHLWIELTNSCYYVLIFITINQTGVTNQTQWFVTQGTLSLIGGNYESSNHCNKSCLFQSEFILFLYRKAFNRADKPLRNTLNSQVEPFNTNNNTLYSHVQCIIKLHSNKTVIYCVEHMKCRFSWLRMGLCLSRYIIVKIKHYEVLFFKSKTYITYYRHI